MECCCLSVLFVSQRDIRRQAQSVALSVAEIGLYGCWMLDVSWRVAVITLVAFVDCLFICFILLHCQALCASCITSYYHPIFFMADAVILFGTLLLCVILCGWFTCSVQEAAVLVCVAV